MDEMLNRQQRREAFGVRRIPALSRSPVWMRQTKRQRQRKRNKSAGIRRTPNASRNSNIADSLNRFNLFNLFNLVLLLLLAASIVSASDEPHWSLKPITRPAPPSRSEEHTS